MKCRDYKAFKHDCLKCDLKTNMPCGKSFDYNIPKKYINVERTDHIRTSWNECPTCGKSIGYYPNDNEFRCPKCNQKILWK